MLKGRRVQTFDDVDYIKCSKPIRALFLETDPKEPHWGFVYYKEGVWSVKMKNIYPIIEEVQNVG